MAEKLFTVAECVTTNEAELIQSALTAAGIAAEVAEAKPGKLEWLHGAPVVTANVQVPLADAEAARGVVAAFRSGIADRAKEGDADSISCLECGAAIPQDADTCPACGWSYESKGGDSSAADAGSDAVKQ